MATTAAQKIAAHIRGIQKLMRAHFGKIDAAALQISASGRIDMTDGGFNIVARGPAKVATVLLRKKRKGAKK